MSDIDWVSAMRMKSQGSTDAAFWIAAANEIEHKDAAIAELVGALKEARRWIGDGPCADGLSAEYWTQEYKDAVSMVDAAIARAKS